MIPVFHSDRFCPQLPEGHRFPMQKYQLIREQLLYEGTLSAEQLRESLACAEEEILRVHDAAYWEAIRTLNLSAREVRKTGFPLSPQLLERSLHSCQGTLSASLAALEHGVGLNIAGGTHHAYPAHGEGFCLINDMAISALHLLTHQHAKRILIVDLDVHQGNGTAVVFADDPRVFTFSMHGKANYPLRKEQSDLDIALEKATEDSQYLSLLQEVLPQLIESHKPDFIFFQAGIDVLHTDKLGTLSLSKQGCKQRDHIVMETCHAYQIPLSVCLGGGYSEKLADTVDAHSNTFRIAMDLFQ